MRDLTIGKAEENQKLIRYLTRYLSEASTGFCYKMLRKKNILLNDKKATGDEILSAGDIVRLYLSEETLAKFHPERKEIPQDTDILLQILYEDDDIIAAVKPAGILSQKAKPEDVSINEVLLHYVKSKEETGSFVPSVANRLDRNTSGIILFGKTLTGSRKLADIIRERRVEKYYYTIVSGVVDAPCSCESYLIKDEKKNLSTVLTEEVWKNHPLKDFAKKIKTSYVPISSNGSYTVLKVKLETGKSHQIRAQLSKLGHPLVGDHKYGGSTALIHHQLLHAGLIIFPAGSYKEERLVIRAPLPDEFCEIAAKLHLSLKETL